MFVFVLRTAQAKRGRERCLLEVSFVSPRARQTSFGEDS